MSASVPASMRIEGLEPRGPGALDGPGQRAGVHVAHADQLRPVGVLVQGVEMVGRDAAAPREREPDPAVSDERFGDEHGSAKGTSD